MNRNGSTGSGGIGSLDADGPAKAYRKRLGARRTLRAVGELVRSRRRLLLVPTLMQVRAMAHFEGREPCSYLLDPQVNYVPELPLGGDDPRGRHALRFIASHPVSGRRFDLLTLPDGCAFDLLGMNGG